MTNQDRRSPRPNSASQQMAETVDYEPGEGLLELAAEERMGTRIKFNEPLARHGSLRIGGPAAVWADVNNCQELQDVLEAASSEDLGLTVVGLGSNVLFPDEGIRGVVAKLSGELAEIDIDQTDEESAVVAVGAGAVNAHVVRQLHKQGFVGAEFLALIPGTFGGAVAMNAGTKEKELAEILIDAELLEPHGASYRRRRLSADELSLSYRHSQLPEEAVVIGGRISVERGEVDQAKQAVRRDKARRNRTQPYKLASVGSTFANPKGDFAGRVIEEVGLKGHAIGGARISELHANFFINGGDATAADFLRLMALARVRVRRKFGLELRPEVEFVGFDGFGRMLAYEHEYEREQSSH